LGCTAVLPDLFGTAGRDPLAPGLPNRLAAARTMLGACISREFTVRATGRSSPITHWLRRLAVQEHARCGGPGVGVVGMCFTGGFALAMAADPVVVAPVLSQPSLPLPITRKRAIDCSDADLAIVARRCLGAGLRVLGLRFDGDPFVPAERFAFLNQHPGDGFLAVTLKQDDGPLEALQVETQVGALMALFSHALGPLSRDDLAELNPTLPLHAIEPALAPLTRFLLGDGLSQGYVLSHSRLGEYWASQHTSAAESRRLEQRFLAYGLNVAKSLRARHLERSGSDVASRLLIVHESWRRAWQFLDGTDTGFLADVRSCRRSLAAANAQASSAGTTISYLAEEILCILCENSVIDQTRHISPELLSALVRRGMWSAMQALVYARQMPDPASSANALLAVAAEMQPQKRREVLAEAIDVAYRESDPHHQAVLLGSVIGRAAGLGATSEAWAAMERLPYKPRTS